ncbi:hypothetical protein ASE63_21025 [Bosea sp. Root381]|nr:hypothetical protein ASE63_21025 [Bosea sp. Root381]
MAKAASTGWSMTSAALFPIEPLPKLVAEPTSVPAEIVVPPVWVLLPASVSVPVPVLVKLPVPERPERVRLASDWMMPPLAPSVMMRDVVMEELVRSVPPFSVTGLLTAPRLASPAIESVPPVTVQAGIDGEPPIKVQVLPPSLSKR